MGRPTLAIVVAIIAVSASGTAVRGQTGEYVRLRSFEIQSFPATKGDWYEAAFVCALKAGARLCRPAEWIAACRSKELKLSGTPEWVDQLTPDSDAPFSGGGSSGSPFGRSEGLRALALFSSCDRGYWARANKEVLPIRCCRDTRVPFQ